MFRYLVLFLWILFLAAGLFRAQSYFRQGDGLLKNFSAGVLQEAKPDAGGPEDFVITLVRNWDFEDFYNAIHPDLKKGVPKEGLEALFNAIAVEVGTLEHTLGIQAAGSFEKTKSVFYRIDAAFSRKKGRIEAELEKSGDGYVIRQFNVEAAGVEKISSAARRAYVNGRFDMMTFVRERDL